MTSSLDIAHDRRGVATVTLNRPAVHNAFDDALIAALSDAFKRLAGKASFPKFRGQGKRGETAADDEAAADEEAAADDEV